MQDSLAAESSERSLAVYCDAGQPASQNGVVRSQAGPLAASRLGSARLGRNASSSTLPRHIKRSAPSATSPAMALGKISLQPVNVTDGCSTGAAVDATTLWSTQPCVVLLVLRRPG